MNADKTKLVFNEYVIPKSITVDNVSIEVVQECNYLGQIIKLGRKNFDKEADRRIPLGCAAFGKLRQDFDSPIPQCLKTKVDNECVLPVTTYGAEM
ncbi:jg22962, partial [Pararge aegeria aegeria]